MEFKDKLDFLLKITSTNNTVLANSINVKPSLISLYKSGKRAMPKKVTTLKNISDFFAENLKTDYQKQALSQISNNPYITNINNTEIISDVIYHWFVNEEMSNTVAYEMLNSLQNDLPFIPDEDEIEYHSEAKNFSFEKFLDDIQNIPNPTTLYIQADDDLNWYFSSKETNEKFHSVIRSLLAKGCKIIHFLPPSSNSYFEHIFNQWIPIYLTNQIEAYYYPRFKDKTFRNHIIVLENEISLFSTSIMNSLTSKLASVSKNLEVVQSLQNVLEDYKKICEPAFQINFDQSTFTKKLMDLYFSTQDKTFVRVTLPLEFAPKSIKDELKKNNSFFYLEKSQYSSLLKVKRGHILDICPLSKKREILSGNAKLNTIGMKPENFPTYTIESYCEHLQNIIDEMERNPNYTFISSKHIAKQPALIQSGKKAILIRNHDNQLSFFELLHPDLVTLLEEYIQQEIDKYRIPYDMHQQSIQYLKSYIEELQK